MNEKYVTSLALSKKLKEAGVVIKSEFSWCNGNHTNNEKLDSWSLLRTHGDQRILKREYEAPASDELLEKLPVHLVLKGQVFRLTIDVDKNKRFYINYLAYKNTNTSGMCDMSVFEHDKSIYGIWTDAFGQEGVHIGGSKSLPDSLASMLLHLTEQGLVPTATEANPKEL